MRCLVLVSLFALAGCSSGGRRTTAMPDQTVRITGATVAGQTNAGLTIASNVGPQEFTVSASLDVVWHALPAIYDSLAIPVTTLDPRDRVIGNQGFKLRRRLGSTALSKYLSCGRSQMGQNADEYEITLSVVSDAVASDSVSTVVRTTVQASAKGLQFAGQFSQCGSTGVLETRLKELLRKSLTAG